MRQLQVQRKMLNSEDWTAALMVKSRQWRDPGKFRQPESRGRIAWSALASYAEIDSGVYVVRLRRVRLRSWL